MMLDPRRARDASKTPRRCAASFRWRLVVMAKLPVAGRVKTRLARQIGTTTAARFTRHTTLALLHRIGRDPRWCVTIAVDPNWSVDSRAWPRGLARVSQGRGNLGTRMQRIMNNAARGPLVIVGTDVPGIAPTHIAEAFRLLGRHDAVFGPADDGGYWLVGFRRRPRIPLAFGNVRWSSPHALADTLANLAGYSTAVAATLRDVDNATDYAHAAATFGRRILPRISSTDAMG